MSNARRTDVHSPSNLVTEDYDFLGCGDYGTADEPGYSPLREPYAQKLLSEGWRFASVDNDGGGCQHCGARLRYFAILLHTPSKTFLRVGEQCLDNRFALASTEFHKLRKAAKLNRERRVLAEVREEFARDNADVVDFLTRKITECEARFGFIPEPDYDTHLNLRFWEFYLSLYARLTRTGLLTEAQVAALRKSAVKDAEREAKRAEERKDAEPVPVTTEKVVVTGQVIKTDWQSNAYGGRAVFTVKDDRGFVLWGTQPSALSEAEKGDRVTFTATVERSERDEFFGFFKRPTKTAIIEKSLDNADEA